MPASKTKSVKSVSKQTPKKVTKDTKATKVTKATKASKKELKGTTKAETTATAAKQVTPTEKLSNGKVSRSFKVKLPGSEDYVGRFTGLTPYQAANKALSSYYRSNPKTKVTSITFTIKESTRGRKRNEYTYTGKREKLETPVEYSIKGNDGVDRTITKAFKNKLTKVKKAELAAQAQAQA